MNEQVLINVVTHVIFLFALFDEGDAVAVYGGLVCNKQVRKNIMSGCTAGSQLFLQKEIEVEEVHSQKTYSLLHTKFFQGSTLAYSNHTSGLENIKDGPGAAPNENIEPMDLRPSTCKTQKTFPRLKKQGIDAGSTYFVVGH
jgi:hypothetical protein